VKEESASLGAADPTLHTWRLSTKGVEMRDPPFAPNKQSGQPVQSESRSLIPSNLLKEGSEMKFIFGFDSEKDSGTGWTGAQKIAALSIVGVLAIAALWIAGSTEAVNAVVDPLLRILGVSAIP
jgi:hypothetical protein